jgi:hypothetical protein
MMSEPSGRQIRSYHRAFHFELMLYTLGNLRPWRPVPARGVFYTGVSVVMMVALAHAPVVGGVVSGVGPEAVYGVIPLALGWLLTVARVEGRRFHIAARVWARHLRTGRTLIGGYRAMKRPGSRWRPRRMLVISDGRDGMPRDALRLEGPGRLLLRYPCSARLDGARLTVVQTSQRPCDPGRVVTIAEGAIVRFIGGTDAAAHDAADEAGPGRSLRSVDESGQPEIGVVVSEEVSDAQTEAGADIDAGVSAGEERGG